MTQILSRFRACYRTQDCQCDGTADYADWSRLGAGYRRQDCQNILEVTKEGGPKGL